jgi:predicted amidophosphoribosyltransferase
MMINYPLDNLSLSRAKEIIEKEGNLKAKEQNHREEELTRKRKEYEKNNLSTLLPACVSSWETHSNSSMKHKYFFEYYPYSTYKDNASASMWDTWRTVWHFKNDPDKNVTSYEHRSALQTVTNLVENALRSAFGSKTEYLTLVCLTASTQRKTELRFKDFAEQVCKDLNMNNAYPHIQVIEGGSAKHDGGDGSRKVSYDRYFFSGKYVVLFDDVRTTGHSLEQERRTMEELGAKVICAVTIAQTSY